MIHSRRASPHVANVDTKSSALLCFLRRKEVGQSFIQCIIEAFLGFHRASHSRRHVHHGALRATLSHTAGGRQQEQLYHCPVAVAEKCRQLRLHTRTVGAAAQRLLPQDVSVHIAKPRCARTLFFLFDMSNLRKTNCLMRKAPLSCLAQL